LTAQNGWTTWSRHAGASAEITGDTAGASKGPTEAVNLLIEKTRRIGHGFRNFDNYRLRLLLACGLKWQAPPVARIRGRQPRSAA
jgi:transposase